MPRALRSFGPYTLHRRLGTGGMATVELASLEHQGQQTWVALKRIHLHLAQDDRAVRAFLNEASLQQRLDHPNVARVIDFGQVDNEPYLALEYLHGVPLSEVMKRLRQSASRWPSRVVVSILTELLAGLHAAHELCAEDGTFLDIVHRDVTPHNIFLTFDGSVKLLDFGVARAVEHTSMTAPGELKGKFAYMSPEQFEGQILDRRSDVFSAGVVAWEALSARLLYPRGDVPATMAAIIQRDAPSLLSVDPDLDGALDAVVQKALARPKTQRWATAKAFADALRPYGVHGLVGKGLREKWLEELFPDHLSTLIGMPISALIAPEIPEVLSLPPSSDTLRDQAAEPFVPEDTAPTPFPDSMPTVIPAAPTELSPLSPLLSPSLIPLELPEPSVSAPGDLRTTLPDLSSAYLPEPPTEADGMPAVQIRPKISEPRVVEERWRPAAPTVALPAPATKRPLLAPVGLGLIFMATLSWVVLFLGRPAPITIEIPASPSYTAIEPTMTSSLAASAQAETSSLGASAPTEPASVMPVAVAAPVSQSLPADDKPPPNPSTVKAKRLLSQGNNYLWAGDTAQAEPLLLECIQLKTEANADCYRALGVLYEEKGEPSRSVEHYQEYLRRQPTAKDAERIKDRLRAVSASAP